jgi:hypothetical protein
MSCIACRPRCASWSVLWSLLLLAGCSKSSDEVWFTPDVGSRDMLTLFTQPERWPRARGHLRIFKFYAGQILASSPQDCPLCGDNRHPNFVQVDAYRSLQLQGIGTAIEVGAVKPARCTATVTAPLAVQAIDNVVAANGSVTYLAMDEPLASAPACGETAGDAAAQVGDFVRLVHDAHADVAVGDIEPYPLFSVADIETWVDTAEARGAGLAFLHLDVDRADAARLKVDVGGDLVLLNAFCHQRALPFGVIISGLDGSSDRAYYDDALAWAGTVASAIGRPDHLIFQSWAVAPDGSLTVPINLPENDPATFSHTRLILDGLQRFPQQ